MKEALKRILAGASNDDGDELESHAEDMIAAIKKGDAGKLCDCLCAFLELYESDEDEGGVDIDIHA